MVCLFVCLFVVVFIDCDATFVTTDSSQQFEKIATKASRRFACIFRASLRLTRADRAFANAALEQERAEDARREEKRKRRAERNAAVRTHLIFCSCRFACTFVIYVVSSFSSTSSSQANAENLSKQFVVPSVEPWPAVAAVEPVLPTGKNGIVFFFCLSDVSDVFLTGTRTNIQQRF